MAGWITADGMAKRQASALETFLGGELTSTLDRLNTLSNQLAQCEGEYRRDILPPLAESAKQLQDRLHDLAPELYRIINHIQAANGSER